MSSGYELFKQGKNVSYLLYMDDLKLLRKIVQRNLVTVTTIQIFSDEFINMEFGLDKYTTLGIFVKINA